MSEQSESTTDLIFEDPPAPQNRGRRSPLAPWLDSLRGHPGQWAKYPKEQLGSSAAVKISNGTGYGVKPGEFEACARGATNKRYWIYARFIGEV